MKSLRFFNFSYIVRTPVRRLQKVHFKFVYQGYGVKVSHKAPKTRVVRVDFA